MSDYISDGLGEGEMVAHKGRTVWVPKGFDVRQVVDAALAIEDRFAVDRFTAHSMALTALEAAGCRRSVITKEQWAEFERATRPTKKDPLR